MQFISKKNPKKKLIILNGTSSSGKTSIARNLQMIFKQPTYVMHLDNFIDMADKRYPYQQTVPGLLSSMMWSTGAFLQNQENVVMDCVLEKYHHENANIYFDEILASLKLFGLLKEVKVFKVKIFAEDSVITVRESKRNDRKKGLAEYQKHRIHKDITYDIEINTSLLTSSQAAMKLFDQINAQ